MPTFGGQVCTAFGIEHEVLILARFSFTRIGKLPKVVRVVPP